MASISIKDMSVSYNRGKSYVLDKLSLEVRDGEFCVFLGPSGCGKSTAMHCIAGLLHPEQGEIRFGEDVMTRAGGQSRVFVPPQERNIAMVFQEYALYPNMTVRENMSFALKTKKAPREEINRQLAAILSSEVRSSFDKDLVKKTVLSLIEASLKDMDIEISADDAASIVKGLSGELATKLKDGLELKVGNGASGIRLVSKDGSGYVDFSSSSVSEILMPYLSQSIKEQIFSE